MHPLARALLAIGLTVILMGSVIASLAHWAQQSEQVVFPGCQFGCASPDVFVNLDDALLFGFLTVLVGFGVVVAGGAVEWFRRPLISPTPVEEMALVEKVERAPRRLD